MVRNVVVLFAVGGLAGGAWAESEGRWAGLVGGGDSALVRVWSERLLVGHEHIVAGRSKAARREIDDVAEEMTERLRASSVAPALLGQVSFLRALAAAHEQDDDAAVWHLQVAESFWPEVSHIDFGAYGLERPIVAAADPKPTGDKPVERAKPGDLVAPRATSRVAPRLPKIFRPFCDEGTVVVQVKVGKDGQPTRPMSLVATDPVLQWLAVEAVREWRFKPARYKDRPVDVVFNVTVNFEGRAPGCGPGPRTLPPLVDPGSGSALAR